jgi:prophage regulatory protein
MKFIRRRQLTEKTGLSYPTLWRKERSGDFPRRRRLGPNSVAWIETEVDEWMKSRNIVTTKAMSCDQNVSAK